MIVRVHAALEDHRLIGAIKEPSRDAQSADPITGQAKQHESGQSWLACRSPTPRTRERPMI
jgi:hypothetical protein